MAFMGISWVKEVMNQMGLYRPQRKRLQLL